MPNGWRQPSGSLFYIAFAPVDQPKIAVAIIVENGGFGAEAAAPIVRKALDYYLLGKRPVKENREPQPKVQSDPALFRSDQELKNPAEPPPSPKPGEETTGNKD
jgi:penicillin-binding protein 2